MDDWDANDDKILDLDIEFTETDLPGGSVNPTSPLEKNTVERGANPHTPLAAPLSGNKPYIYRYHLKLL